MKKTILVVIGITAIFSVFIMSRYGERYKNLSYKYIEYKYIATDKNKQKEGIEYFWERESYESFMLKTYILDGKINENSRDFVVLTIGQTNKAYLRKVLFDCLTIDDEKIRADIAWSLGRYCDLTDQEFSRLVDILANDKSELVRARLAMILMVSQNRQKCEDLYSKYYDASDKKIELISRVAIYHFSPNPITKRRVDMIVQGNFAAKVLFLAVAGNLKDKNLEKYIKVLEKDKNKDIRKSAFQAAQFSDASGSLPLGACQ